MTHQAYPKRVLAIKNQHVRAMMKYHYRDVHRNNFGYFGVYTGLPGHGKTEQAILHAWIQDETFNEDTLKDKVCSRPRQFIKAINEMGKYEWVIWMDAGLSTALSARNWQKITNTLVNDITMVMRIKKMGVIFDSQMIGFIDKSTRSLFRWFNEVKRFENHAPEVRMHNIQVNQQTGKIYFPYPVFRMGQRLVKFGRMTMRGRLPKQLRRKFDEVHMAAKESVLKQHYKMIEKIEQEENPMDVYEMIEHVGNNLPTFQNKLGNIDTSLIKIHFNIGLPRAVDIKKFVEKNVGVKPGRKRLGGGMPKK